jgi:Fe-S-cluster containining protein
MAGRKKDRSSARPPAPPPARARVALPLLEDGRRQVPCHACGLCCTYVALEIDEPETVKEASQVLWYLYHDAVSVYVEDDDWLIQLESRCQHLGDDNRCGIYERRPDICRAYDEKHCEVNAAEVGVTFHTPRQFLEHLSKTRPRIHKLLLRDYGPPEHTLDGRRAGTRRLPPFPTRYARLRDEGSV